MKTIKKILGYPFGILLSAVAAAAFFLFAIHSYNQGVVTCVSTNEKLVALTVDDGPDPKYSPRIVDILDHYGIKATFFVVGEQIEKYPDILLKEVESGNEIANHSYTHPNLDKLDRAAIKEEIKRTTGIIYQYTGQNVNWFRPPRKQYDKRVIKEAKRQGLETILWSTGVETKATSDPEEMARRVISQVKPGGIILMHDSRLNREPTIKTLPIIIEALEAQGYKFVTLSQLLKKKESNGRAVQV